jgi:hypothetical protein
MGNSANEYGSVELDFSNSIRNAHSHYMVHGLAGAPPPSGLAADERQAYDQLAFFYQHGLGYALEMGNRPQTLYGIADSPIGLAAWILDHDAHSYALMTRLRRSARGPHAG